jgi:hypothetical protein
MSNIASDADKYLDGIGDLVDWQSAVRRLARTVIDLGRVADEHEAEIARLKAVSELE